MTSHIIIATIENFPDQEAMIANVLTAGEHRHGGASDDEWHQGHRDRQGAHHVPSVVRMPRIETGLSSLANV